MGPVGNCSAFILAVKMDRKTSHCQSAYLSSENGAIVVDHEKKMKKSDVTVRYCTCAMRSEHDHGLIQGWANELIRTGGYTCKCLVMK